MPTDKKLEHARAARLWLLVTADQVDELQQPILARRLRDIAELIVADARELVLSLHEDVLSSDNGSAGSTAEYDSQMIKIINQELKRLTEKHGLLAGQQQMTLASFSYSDLRRALFFRERARPMTRQSD